MSWVLIAVAGYAAAGLAFGIFFVWKGVARVDPAAAHSSPAFRLLILPGVAALWPLMIAKWRRAQT